jgi:glycosidase
MKNKYAVSLFLMLCTCLSFGQITTAPSPVIASQSATITFNKTGTPLAAYTGVIYVYVGVTVNGVQWQNIKGSAIWGNNSQPTTTVVNSSTSTLSISPDLFSYFGVANTNSITQICIIFRSADATIQTADAFIPVGAFQYNLTSPLLNSNNIVASGSNVAITANNTNGNASYQLFVNGSTTALNTQTTSSYSFSDPNVTVNKNYELKVTQGNTSFSARFSVIINPGSLTAAMPAGLVDGINYNPTDPTKATLVLNVPFKSFVYVAGSFNNWQPTAAFAMRRDNVSGATKYWLELTGLTPGQIYAYQYWVCDVVNVPAGSPAIVKTADPFSTLVLSPFDDPEIITLGAFPGLPVYATIAPGQEREVSVLQTGPNSLFAYNWSEATTNFVKPKKKDLVFYEILLRDFDANRTYQDVINKINYFKDLKINAIKIMPVMEFEGNMSWGYNTAFHMALDKRYGSPAKLKELVDLCHQNGIAVILDLALNHVFGRSPLERMWMLDPDNDGWANANTNGERTTLENPYINQTPRHSYNVGSDINHFRETGPGGNLANTYSLRTIKYWIEEFKIDGYRWDLTKGFTQNCPFTGNGSAQESCTNGYQPDRVAKMKWYADNQWLADPNSLVIFEHLGTGGSAQEELEWANYNRIGEIGGIMQWRKMTDPYANLLKGNFADITGVTDATNRFIGYAESHDEERVVYKALNDGGANQTFGNLAKVLQRLPAMGSMLFLVPGPKMIWHFGALGWDESIFLCSNGTVQFNDGCKLDTKPQPQWTENWMSDPARMNVYNSWAKMIDLKKTEPVFENGQHTFNLSVTGSPRLDVFTVTNPTANLSYVFVRTNFSDNTLNTSGGFPFVGIWYDLMDNSTINVTSTNQNISIEPGGFRVYGNQAAVLNQNTFEKTNIVLQPNPSSGTFYINTNAKHVIIYNITGQVVKEFKGTFDSTNAYSIDGLNTGMYLVKVTDENNNQSSIKLIKK